MYRVLVADDEYPFLQSLIQYDWAEWNCTLVGTAMNGADALEKVRSLKPQILIADINMPVMNGIELIRTVKSEMPGVQIILFTVYKEFDYAREAVRVGVVDYILKDAYVKENLSKAIVRAAANCTESRKNEMLTLSMNANMEKSDAEGLLKSLSLRPEGLLTLRLEKSAGSQLAFERFFSPDNVMIRWNSGEIELLTPDASRLWENLPAFQTYAAEKTGGRVLAACARIDESAQGYFHAHDVNILNLDRMFYGLEPVPSSSAPSVSRNRLSKDKSFLWAKELLRRTSYREIEEYLRCEIVPDAVSGLYPPHEMRLAVERMLFQFELKYSSEAMEAHRLAIRASFTLSALTEAFSEGVSEILSVGMDSGYLVNTALSFMQEHLANPDLKLSDVSETLLISAGYLSKMLKKTVGKSFQELLIEMRMDKALSLLRSTNTKVYEIAEICGYTNYRSFVNAFTAYHHKSPKQFR